MSEVRVYFDLESIEGLDYHSVAIYECESPDDTGVLIDTIKIRAGDDFVDSLLATDPFSWFKVIVLDPLGEEVLPISSAVLAEATQNILLDIRTELKDTREHPAFSDSELIRKMRLGVLRFNAKTTIANIASNIWSIIVILVRIDCCLVLAYDYARYLRLEIPGGAALSKDQLYTHYLQVATQLESYYQAIKKDLDKNMLEPTDDDGSVISVSTYIYDDDEVV